MKFRSNLSLGGNVLHHEEPPQSDVHFPKPGKVNGDVIHRDSGMRVRKIGQPQLLKPVRPCVC